MGRGGLVNTHAGNKDYLQYVLSRKPSYRQLASRAEKTAMSWEVVDWVHNRGGRFLHRIVCDGKTSFSEASDSEKREKTSMGLRQKDERPVREGGQESGGARTRSSERPVQESGVARTRSSERPAQESGGARTRSRSLELLPPSSLRRVFSDALARRGSQSRTSNYQSTGTTLEPAVPPGGAYGEVELRELEDDVVEIIRVFSADPELWDLREEFKSLDLEKADCGGEEAEERSSLLGPSSCSPGESETTSDGEWEVIDAGGQWKWLA